MGVADRIIREKEWGIYNAKRRRRLKNYDFSIISTNCCATIMYHDLGLRFASPTINLTIGIDDFLKLASSLEWYMDQKLIWGGVQEDYPVGMLGDVKVNFIHYKTFEEAAQKWEERKKRINWNNLFITATDRGGCTYETIRRFEQLPYKNKVIFTHVRYPEFSSAYYIKGFEEEKELGIITDFKNQFLKRRYMDDFDYVSFLNKGGWKCREKQYNMKKDWYL